MRIIGGKFKGKKLIEPKDKETRPLKDLTKESIFNIIKHSNKFVIQLDNSYILDLFSGVGSFGIECLSREAKFVTFVENYSNALSILERNLNNLKIKNYEILNFDIISSFNKVKFDKQYNIIFLDPPYKEKNITKIINEILNSKILLDDGIVIIHRHKKESDKYPEEFKILDIKEYGVSKIIFGTF